MMSLLFLDVLLVLELTFKLAAAECRPLVVSLPFKGNVLGTKAETRGVSFHIGSPNTQSISLLPSALVLHNSIETYH